MFAKVANELIEAGQDERAEEVLDKAMESVPVSNYPLDLIYLETINDLSVVDMIAAYLKIGAYEKGEKLANDFCLEMLESVKLFGKNIAGRTSMENMETVRSYYFSVLDLLYTAGRDEAATRLEDEFKAVLESLIGSPLATD